MAISHLKIALVINYPERDKKPFQRVKAEIEKMDPSARVDIVQWHFNPFFFTEMITLAPHIVMTFPFTAVTTSHQFYLLKYLLGCTIVCFRTEGLANPESPSLLATMAGLERYNACLVDYEIFWGRRMAETVGRLLIEQGRISSRERLTYLGAPYFEDYTDPSESTDHLMPAQVREILADTYREKTVLFVTGFLHADYSPQDLIRSGDFIDQGSQTTEKDLEEAKSHVRGVRHFRLQWIDAIAAAAAAHPDLRFVVKIHPMEVVVYREKKNDPYASLQGYKNILLITEAVPLMPVISRCGLLFHYGSTTMLEAYLAGIPSVYVDLDGLRMGSRRFEGMDTIGVPSTLKTDISNVSAIVTQHAASPISFSRDPRVEEHLADIIDLKMDAPYRPSEKIARFLLSLKDKEPLPISHKDEYFLNALRHAGTDAITRLVYQGIAKIKAEDYQNALGMYLDKALQLVMAAGVKLPKLQYMRAICLIKMGFADEALNALQKEAAIEPSDKQTLDLLGQLEEKLNPQAAMKKTEAVSAYPADFTRIRPSTFMVETILGCNLHCPECAVGGNMIERKKGWMSFERFRLIADKIRPYCKYLYLHIWGEPLLNKDIFKIIAYASTFTRTNISTNGMLLTRETAEKLIASGVSDVIVSIDGVSQEVYEKYRVGGSAEKALGALKMLQECNQKAGCPITIIPQYVVFAHNQDEMEAFSDICRAIGLTPTFKAPYIRSGSRYANADDPAYTRSSYTDTASLKKAMTSCPSPVDVLTVLLDGSCVMCCYDHNCLTNYGNLFEQEVLEIWNSEAYLRDRWNIVQGNPPPFCLENCLHWTLEPAEKKGTHHLSGFRTRTAYDVSNGQKWLERARTSYAKGNFNQAFDIYEQLAAVHSGQATAILAEVYDCFQRLPVQDRYSLYQARFLEFAIAPGDKVLDIGSGNNPFPLATHLADIAIDDDRYRRAGEPFKHVDGKPVFLCNMENMQFGEQEFDFIYCSHVLEHAREPEKACRELMRVGRAGYIETPGPGKDLFLNTARISNHLWTVEAINGVLTFTEYDPKALAGLESDILMQMHMAPQTLREKAFSALICLKADRVNTMFFWEKEFAFDVRRQSWNG
jgi:surface carbohydrate biosynthesis protein